jgi:transcription initiation factor TFIIH subunit 1
MRATPLDIQRTLNSISIKLLDTVTPADALSSPSAPQTLTDLEPPPPEDSIPLHIQKTSSTAPVAADATRPKEKPARPLYKALLGISAPNNINLAESAVPATPASYAAATAQITTLLHNRASHHKQNINAVANTSDIPEQVTMCHASNMEFLRHFYNAFLSGDGKRSSGEAGKIATSLERGMKRSEVVREQLGPGGKEMAEMLKGSEECLDRAVKWWASVNS